MGFGWLSQFEFTDAQRQELLAIIGITEAEGADLLESTRHAIRVCQADMSEELTPAQMKAQLRALERCAKKLSATWPTNPDVDRLLTHGLRGSVVVIRYNAADAWIPVVDDIAIACSRALTEVDELYDPPRRGRQTNVNAHRLAHSLSRHWQDHWGERAPRGKMLRAVEYLIAVAETTGDARRALEIVLPPVEKKRGKVRRTPAKSRRRT